MRTFFFVFFCSLLFSERISIDGNILEVEIADTHESRAKGLMGRLDLEEDHGMLFVYKTAQPLCFWMKNTFIPLSIAFFNEDKVLLQILDMDPPFQEPYPLYKSKTPALYALEVPQGWFRKKKIKPGVKFSFLSDQNHIESTQ
jgi:uncharacterized membrane protein (UPF0127 family)